MCGRFGVEQQYVQLALRYQATVDAIDPGPRFNVAPTQPVAVIRDLDGQRVLVEHRWGLVPAWAKDISIGSRMINARAETIATQSAFRDPLVSQRCIVPATRFYEWQTTGRVKQPFSIQRTDGEVMSFAGLWARWWDRAHEQEVLSCTVITTTPNAVMASLHDRMPVILDGDDIDLWLDPTVRDPATLQLLLRPNPDDVLFTFPVSTRLNNARNEGPDLVAQPSPEPRGFFDDLG